MAAAAVVAGALAALLALPAGCGAERRCQTVQPDPPCGANRALVKRVIDGDTVVLDDDTRIRYIGVDTPELTGSEAFSAEARDFNRSLVEGVEVDLEYDESCLDYFKRTLAYVCVGETMVNEELLKAGLARTDFIPPDTRYESEFEALEQQAKDQGVGMWAPP